MNTRIHLGVGFVGAAVVPSLLLLDTVIALARGWPLDSKLDGLIILVACAALAASLMLLVLRRGRLFLVRRWPNLALLSGSVVVTCFLLETVVARWFSQEPEFHTSYPGIRTMRPNPEIMPGVSGVSRVSINSLGIRGPEFPPENEVVRVLCVGGSTTLCLYLDDSETWPHLLGVMLGRNRVLAPVWVGNVGSSGFASQQHLKFVRTSSLAGEVDCIVFLTGFNDFILFLRGEQPATWVQDRLRPLWARSGILTLIRRIWWQFVVTEDTTIENSDGANYVRRRSRRQSARICNRLPRLETGLKTYAENIRSIVAECRAKDVRPVFMTQPALWDEALPDESAALLYGGRLRATDTYLTVDKLRQGIDRYNHTLVRVCRQTGTECLDLTMMDGHPEFFYDDCHFTEAGAREVARRLANWFSAHPFERAR